MLRLAITAGSLLVATTAFAQFSQSGSQTSGAFGSRSIGQGTTAGTSGFSSGNTSGMGGTTAGGNSMGGSGSSSSGSGQLGGAPSQGFQLGSSLSSAQQRSSAGFIGADAGDANSSNVRSMQATQNQAMQNAFSQLARQNQQRNQNQNQNQNQQNGKKQLRIPIKADIALTTAATTPTSLGRQFEMRLTKLPTLEKGNSVKVTMQGRTAVLTGTVASERDQKLVAGLALLEPGISAVRNELVVAAAGATAEELPAPAH